LSSNEKVKFVVRERPRTQKPTSNATTEFSNTCHCEIYASIRGEIALKNNVTSVDQSCSTERCKLF